MSPTRARWSSASVMRRYGPGVQLQLGRRSFDITSRTLTLLSLDVDHSVDESLGDPAVQPDIVEVVVDHAATAIARVARVQSVFVGTIAVRTNNARLAALCLNNGADMAHDPDGFGDPNYPRVIEEAGATVAVSCPEQVSSPRQFLIERIRWAMSAGIASNKILANAASDQIVAVANCAAVMFDGGRGTDAQGAHAIAVMNGARVIARTPADNDLRVTKRTADTVSELLERREPVGAH